MAKKTAPNPWSQITCVIMILLLQILDFFVQKTFKVTSKLADIQHKLPLTTNLNSLMLEGKLKAESNSNNIPERFYCKKHQRVCKGETSFCNMFDILKADSNVVDIQMYILCHVFIILLKLNTKSSIKYPVKEVNLPLMK